MPSRVTLVRILSILALLSVSTVRSGAQAVSSPPNGTPPVTSPTPDALQRAAALFVASDWRGSLDAYTTMARNFPQYALARFRIGVSQMELGQFADAEKNLRAGEQMGISPAQAAFRLAQLRTAQRRPDDAISELTRAIQSRLPLVPSALDADPHFATLKSHPKWQATLDALDAITRPCMHDARYREFDFWIGDWDVRAVGVPAVGPSARNTITLIDNGCVAMEHWVAPNGAEGHSFNMFDRSRAMWRQTWVDNSGGEHNYHGGLRGRDMVFEGDTPAPGGQLGRTPTRLTFFHISTDSVRQFSQTSPDSGKTWVTAYDLLYVRRKGSP